LKKLFRDPRFNVMDGLDVYIDDYSIADPLEPELARKLAHARYIFDPPRTRVNEAGIVEDLPPEEAATDAGALPPAATTPLAAATLGQATTAPDAPVAPVAASRSLPNVTSESAGDAAATDGKPREGTGPERR
jgi:hypothetical protein